MSKAVVKFGKAIILDVKRCSWVIERLDILAQTIKSHYVEMCELLYEAAEGRYYTTLKDKDGKEFERFEDFVADRFGWKDRKGDYFIAIHKKLVVEGKVTKEELAKIDWSKASQIARLPATERTPEKLKDKWMPAAKEKNFPALIAEVNKAKNEDAGNKDLREEETIKRTFYLYPEQAKSMDRAIELAKKINKSDKIGHALECVCLDFYGSRCEEAGVKMERILGAVERFWNIEIVGFKFKGQEVEIVHGQKLAKKYGIE
jgi:hypothetical protein